MRLHLGFLVAAAILGLLSSTGQVMVVTAAETSVNNKGGRVRGSATKTARTLEAAAPPPPPPPARTVAAAAPPKTGAAATTAATAATPVAGATAATTPSIATATATATAAGATGATVATASSPPGALASTAAAASAASTAPGSAAVASAQPAAPAATVGTNATTTAASAAGATTTTEEGGGNNGEVARVKLAFWTTPRGDWEANTGVVPGPNIDVSRFLREIVIALGDRVDFEPQMYISDGADICADGAEVEANADPLLPSAKTEVCDDSCISGMRYCSIPSTDPIHYKIKGKTVVEESLRRICVWGLYGRGLYKTKKATESSTVDMDPRLNFFDYLETFMENKCDAKFAHACTSITFKNLGIDTDVIDACISQSGGLSTPNVLLQDQLDLENETSIHNLPRLPAILVDGNPLLDGQLTKDYILYELCSRFPTDDVPDACTGHLEPAQLIPWPTSSALTALPTEMPLETEEVAGSSLGPSSAAPTAKQSVSTAESAENEEPLEKPAVEEAAAAAMPEAVAAAEPEAALEPEASAEPEPSDASGAEMPEGTSAMAAEAPSPSEEPGAETSALAAQAPPPAETLGQSGGAMKTTHKLHAHESEAGDLVAESKSLDVEPVSIRKHSNGTSTNVEGLFGMDASTSAALLAKGLEYIEMLEDCGVDTDLAMDKMVGLVGTGGYFSVYEEAAALEQDIPLLMSQTCPDPDKETLLETLETFHVCSLFNLKEFLETFPSTAVGVIMRCAKAYSTTPEEEIENGFIPEQCVRAIEAESMIGRAAFGLFLYPDVACPCMEDLHLSVPECTADAGIIPINGAALKVETCMAMKYCHSVDRMCDNNLQILNKCLPPLAGVGQDNMVCEDVFDKCSEFYDNVPPMFNGTPLPDACQRIAQGSRFYGQRVTERYDLFREKCGQNQELWEAHTPVEEIKAFLKDDIENFDYMSTEFLFGVGLGALAAFLCVLLIHCACCVCRCICSCCCGKKARSVRNQYATVDTNGERFPEYRDEPKAGKRVLPPEYRD